MKILICDDEPLAIQRLSRLVTKLGHQVVATAQHGKQAIQQVKQYQPDVVLLDVQMPEMDGLYCAEQLKQLDPSLSIVFCTAYEAHALDAFRLHADGYLLKPVVQHELQQTLEHLQQLKKAQRHHVNEPVEIVTKARQHISAKTHKGIELVALDDIYYFLADQKYVMVRHKNGRMLIDDTLKELEQEFALRFMRIHRNALVAVQYLIGLEVQDSQAHVCLQGIDEKLLVSRRHLTDVKERLTLR